MFVLEQIYLQYIW